MRVVVSSLVLLWMGTAGVALSQGDALCDAESGAAADLCAEYCGSLACHLANDGDRATEARGSTGECGRIGRRFESLTGREVPCERLNACPCLDPERWADPDAGTTWETFADELYNAEDTACTDEGSQVQLIEDIPDVDRTGAGVDVIGAECQAWVEGRREALILRVTEGQARACLRLLRQAGGDLCR